MYTYTSGYIVSYIHKSRAAGDISKFIMPKRPIPGGLRQPAISGVRPLTWQSDGYMFDARLLPPAQWSKGELVIPRYPVHVPTWLVPR